MTCLRCGAASSEGRRLCGECRAALALACPSCGFSNEPGMKFCGGCGTSLVVGNPLFLEESVRTLVVVIVERPSGRLVWKLGPPTPAQQHDPRPLPNGDLLIFDHGTHRQDDPIPHSRVIQVDPRTSKIVWEYDIEKELKPAIERFDASVDLRPCRACGHVQPEKPPVPQPAARRSPWRGDR